VSRGRWRIEIDPRALKELRKLSPPVAQGLLRFVNERLLSTGDPRSHGKALQGDLKGHWRYRVGDYRIIARIDDGVFLITVLAIAHRREVYR
jgi:mRNA interferase RelE/StbE